MLEEPLLDWPCLQRYSSNRQAWHIAGWRGYLTQCCMFFIHNCSSSKSLAIQGYRTKPFLIFSTHGGRKKTNYTIHKGICMRVNVTNLVNNLNSSLLFFASSTDNAPFLQLFQIVLIFFRFQYSFMIWAIVFLSDISSLGIRFNRDL